MTRDEARAFVAAVVTMRADAEDKLASEAVEVYPRLHGDGRLIAHGTRVNWQGQLKRAAVDLYDNEQSTPDAAPALWEDIEYREGIRIIPEAITPGTAFSKGEKGWWGDQTYTSTMDGNVWNPEQNPTGWEVESPRKE